MKAVCWNGKHDIRVETVPDPKILNPRDAVIRDMRPLLEHIQKGEIDTSFVISHRLKLDDAPHGYEVFNSKEEHCTKVVMKP